MEEQPELVTDILYELALKSPDPEKLCMSNKYLHDVCEDPMFWKKKYLRDFGAIVDLPAPKLRKYYKSYGTISIGKIANDKLEFLGSTTQGRFKKVVVDIYADVYALNYDSELYSVGVTGATKLISQNVYNMSDELYVCYSGEVYDLSDLTQIGFKGKAYDVASNYIIDDKGNTWEVTNYPNDRVDMESYSTDDSKYITKLPIKIISGSVDHVIDADNEVWLIDLLDHTFLKKCGFKAKEVNSGNFIDMDDYLNVITMEGFHRIDVKCRQIVSQSGDNIMVIDMDYNLVYINLVDLSRTHLASDVLSASEFGLTVVIGMRKMI